MILAFLEKLAIRLFEFLQDLFSPQRQNRSLNFFVGTAQSLFDRNKTEEINLSTSEKESHVYILGSTGSGKTTFLQHLIRQHILLNEGIAVVDVHGDLSAEIIKFMAHLFQNKSDREKQILARRLVLIEPFDLRRIVSFNPLEVMAGESIYSTVLELVEIFRARWAEFWGPRTNELLRNTLVILAENKLTLLEAPALLMNHRFRNSLAANVQNEEAKNWIYRYGKLTEPQKTMYRDPSLNKIGEFLGDASIRYLIGQEKSSFSFRDAMDKQRIVILNLSKAKLKTNAFLAAGLFLAKLQTNALTRADIPYPKRKSFYVYADEFQNFVSEEVSDIETILSEARKYKIFLRVAHQNLYQIDRKLTEAILGNTKIMLVFRVNHSDAFVLSQELNPGAREFLTKKLTELEVGEAFLKIRGKPHRLVKLPLPEDVKVGQKTIDELRDLSLSYYARPLQEVEKEIYERRKKYGLVKEKSQSQAGKPGDENDEW